MAVRWVGAASPANAVMMCVAGPVVDVRVAGGRLRVASWDAGVEAAVMNE
jgi:hypothetical protein